MYYIPQDIANHFIYGNFAGLLAAGMCSSLGFPQYSRLTAVVVSGIVGLGKEGFDWLQNRKAVKAGLAKPHGVQLHDYFATQIGGFNIALTLSI